MARTTTRKSTTTRKASATGERFDLYATVTAKVTEALRNGVVPWHKPWKATAGGGMSLPLSMSTRRPYRGANVFLLAIEAQLSGWSSPWWGTYDHIAKLGGQVRKGEHSTMVVFWRTGTKDVRNEETGEVETKRWAVLRYFRVFNAEQADGLPARFYPAPEVEGEVTTEAERIADAEAIVTRYVSTGPTLRHAPGGRAFYDRDADAVVVPPVEAFHTVPGYYSTLFHELTHSTGHRSRLDRRTLIDACRFGDTNYSQEELVAEMGAAMLCAVAGIPQDETIPQSAAYIASWLRTFEGDPKMLVMAGAQAQRAVDMIAPPAEAVDVDDDEGDPLEAGDEVAAVA